jgi:hypothetical protein
MNQQAFDEAQKSVLERNQYGQRIESALGAGWIISFSNGSVSWWRIKVGKVKRGQVVNLDSNEIIVYAKAREVDEIATHLPPHPLYWLSTESKERFLENCSCIHHR